MLIQVNKIDNEGFIVEPLVVTKMDVLQADLVSVPVPEGLYIPQWTGSEWIDSASEEYKYSVDNPERELTEVEILRKEKAELESRLEAVEMATLSLMDFM